MRKAILILFMAASVVAASAQTPANPTATSTTAAKPATKTASAAKSKTTDSKATKPPAGPQLPPGVPPVQGPAQTAFSLQYQEIQIGTGAEAEPNKLYKVHYTGWLASDGKKFDSSYDHRSPVMDKDKKPVLDADGKPEMGDPQPLSFPQGFGRLIPGWDQGFYGMKIGGKRRLFIPWQLAYGARGRPGPDAAHPVIPPKADLIFDVELLDVTEMPQPATRPGASAVPNGIGRPPGPVFGKSPQPGASAAPAQPGTGAAPSAAATPAAPAAAPAASTAPAAAPTAAAPAAPVKPAASPSTNAPAAQPRVPAQPPSN